MYVCSAAGSYRKFPLLPCISAPILFAAYIFSGSSEEWTERGCGTVWHRSGERVSAGANQAAQCCLCLTCLNTWWIRSCLPHNRAKKKRENLNNRHAIVNGDVDVRCKNFYCIQMVYIFLKGFFVVLCRMSFFLSCRSENLHGFCGVWCLHTHTHRTQEGIFPQKEKLYFVFVFGIVCVRVFVVVVFYVSVSHLVLHLMLARVAKVERRRTDSVCIFM